MSLVLASSWLTMAIAGLGIGFLVGCTGVGAGALTTPMLVGGFGVPPAVAVGTDLLFAAITKATGAWRHHRLGNVDWAVLGWLAAGSLAASLAVLAWLYLGAPDTTRLAVTIKRGLSVALVASAIAIPLYPLLRRAPSAEGEAPPRRLRPLATLTLGLVLGGLVTLTSVGAGAIGVVALCALYPSLLARSIVGTDVVHAVPLTMLSGLGHLGLGHVDLGVLAAMLAGSIPGIALGSRLTGCLPDWSLRLALSLVLLGAAWMLLAKA
ncbi:MAG: sulfite exporter TauE/SafE family protein [Pseudomonadota bacterium]